MCLPQILMGEFLMYVPYTDFTTLLVTRYIKHCSLLIWFLSLLPLYSNPHVRIQIGSTSTEYKLSKALLYKQSPYFAATFKGKFQEGEEQSTALTKIDGVVSTQSFELLVQWLYLGQVIFGELISCLSTGIRRSGTGCGGRSKSRKWILGLRWGCQRRRRIK